jgi:uncharacterized PurR-regulated membrane protein YhhQ (DUF165 family)
MKRKVNELVFKRKSRNYGKNLANDLIQFAMLIYITHRIILYLLIKRVIGRCNEKSAHTNFTTACIIAANLKPFIGN